MLRIPNPGSNIDQLIRTFQDLHPYLKDKPSFGLDEITQAMIAKSNVTSHGAIGAEASRRSQRADRSRDALYNQSKMYSELYRALGWIHSVDGSLIFRFTALGHHLATATDPNALARECFLAMAFPNEVLAVKGNQSVRAIGTALIALAKLGSLSRGEMIVGPMSILDDTSEERISSMLTELRQMRKKPGALDARLDQIATERRIKRGSTMTNYVRVPMAVPPWAGWAAKSGAGVLTVTPAGIEAAERLLAMRDFRLRDFAQTSEKLKGDLIISSNYRLLERGGFELGPVESAVRASERAVAEAGIEEPIFFSPFQQLSHETLATYAPSMLSTEGIDELTSYEAAGPTGAAKLRVQDAPLLVQTTEGSVVKVDRVAALEKLLREGLGRPGVTIDALADQLHLKFGRANKDKFYPLIADLLTLVGFDCHVTRHGVNSSREDALIHHPVHCIPVEIKSPGEEIEISVKGVRQALENKIILLARDGDPHATTPATTSLVVGYNPPNDRSEVYELIDDISVTFGVNVGVIDFRTLLRLALRRIQANSPLDLGAITIQRGVLRVETSAPSR